MDYTLHQITTSGITKIEFSGDPETIQPSKEYWMEINTGRKNKLAEQFQKFNLDPRVLTQVQNPETSNIITVTSNTIVINLIISRSDNIYMSEYLTLLLKPNLLVTIIDGKNNLLNDLEAEINNIPFELSLNIYHTMYFMINLILHKSTNNVKEARQVVDNLSQLTDEEPHQLEIQDIIQAKRKIHDLANIIEDQYVTLQSIPKFDWSDHSVQVEDATAKVVSQFDFLYRSVNRLEEKIKELQLQYQLILQESGNKRLNTLTIIQAIFVPLTLIAGIYGMNFLVMPELSWSSGYFIILGVMVFIAAIELWIFKHNGWFD
jgi:Mg2+ and Co2+ transporter CorA